MARLVATGLLLAAGLALFGARVGSMFYANLAMVKLGHQQPAVAVALAERARALDAGNPLAAYAAGRARLAVGDAAGAISVFQKALYVSPDHLFARTYLGEAFAMIGEKEQAIRQWTVVQNPALTKWGDDAFRRGDFTQAVEEYQLVATLAPMTPDAYIGLGRAYYNLGRQNDAIEAFEQAVRLTPRNPVALTELGTSLFYGRGEVEHALQLIRQAIVIFPECYWCYLKLAHVYLDAGQAEETIITATAARKFTSPEDLIPDRLMAEAYLRSGRPMEAVSVLQAALTRNPSDAEAFFLLGNSYRTARFYQEAAEAYRAAVQLNPNDQRYRDSLVAVSPP